MNRKVSVPVWGILLFAAFFAGWLVHQPPTIAFAAQNGEALAAIPPVTKSMNANYVDGFHASKTPKPKNLLPLNGSNQFPISVIPQGSGSGLNADMLDGLDSGLFAQKSEVMSIVTANDGSGSGVNADYLDGYNSSDLTKGYSGTQVTGSNLAAGANQYWFTFGYSTSQLVVWQAIPTTNGGKVKLDVETELGNGTLTYWLRVTNVGTVTTNYNLVRYTLYQ